MSQKKFYVYENLIFPALSRIYKQGVAGISQLP